MEIVKDIKDGMQSLRNTAKHLLWMRKDSRDYEVGYDLNDYVGAAKAGWNDFVVSLGWPWMERFMIDVVRRRG